MRRKRSLGSLAAGVSCALVLVGSIDAWAQQDAADQKIAAIKQSLQTSMAALRSYEWIETVTVRVKGEQKSQKQNRCYYGADGTEQKVPLGDPSGGEKTPHGIRGRIAKSKKKDMEEYIQQATGLIKQYVPPDPQRLQAVKNKGAQTVTVLDNATRLRVDFPAYLKAGDVLSVDVDPNADRVLGVSVATYLEDDPKDAVKLNVVFGTFQDGTIYPAKITLHGESKELDVAVENSGYRKSQS